MGPKEKFWVQTWLPHSVISDISDLGTMHENKKLHAFIVGMEFLCNQPVMFETFRLTALLRLELAAYDTVECTSFSRTA